MLHTSPALRMLSLATVLALPPAALAAPGDLDTTFNTTGFAVTPVANGGAEATAVVRQPDGKLVAGGYANVPTQANPDNLDFALVRYTHDGMLDGTFGGTGIVTTPIRGGDDEIHALIVQQDGKLLAAGYSYDGPAFNNSAVTLARYLDNGDLDPSFGGGDGIVELAANADYDQAFALIQQADQKIVVAGSAGTDVLVLRLALDGTPDATFNGTGRVTTTAGAFATIRALLQQATDQKLVVAGSSDGDLLLVRYDTVGMPDASFDIDGIVVTPASNGGAEARGIVQQASDGKLVVAGTSGDGSDTDVTLARYALDGDLDDGFGTMGIAITPINASDDDEAMAIAAQDDGKLVVAGWVENGTNRDVALVRYDTAGDPDPDFGTGGIVTTPVGTQSEEAYALAIQPNGGLVVAGYTRVQPNTANFLVARYLSLTGTTTSSTVTTTTSTSSSAPVTTSVPGSTTTTTTVPETALVPGGPSRVTASDCYLELAVQAVGASQIERNQVVSCTDGDPCDQGPCGDRRCDVAVAACASQSDPALPDCTPPASLDTVRLSGALAGSAGQLLAGPACGPVTQLQVPVKITKRGVYQRGKSRVVIRGSAKAARGVSPRKDKDKWTFQCLPRVGECPQ